MAKKEFSAIPLGGVGEIGALNMMAYECDGDMILVDAGVSFPDDWCPGADMVIPDISYVTENIDRLKAIFITHVHLDHVGALQYLWSEIPVPVYCTQFAKLFIEDQVKQTLGDDLPNKIIEVKSGEKTKIGSFEVEFARVVHSVPETSGLFIRTSHGNVFHTGDYKFDDNPEIPEDKFDAEHLESLAEEGVLALLSDSTNVFASGHTKSDKDLAESLTEIIDAQKGRVILTTFASNMGRVRLAMRIAEKTGRKVAVLGYSLKKMVGYCKTCGYLDSEMTKNIIDIEEANKLSDNKVMVLVTGSQGESRAALARISRGEYPLLKAQPTDSFVMSALVVPGNELAVNRVENRLAKLGAKVIKKTDGFVHISGHGYKEDLQRMYKMMKPQLVIPVHGEYQHFVKNCELARESGVLETRILENGTKILFSSPDFEMKKNYASTGRHYVDGLNIVDDDQFIFSERRKLSQTGAAFITLPIEEATGHIIGKPILKTKGLIDEELQADLVDYVADQALIALIKNLKEKKVTDPRRAEEIMRISVRNTFDRERGRKPITVATILTV